MNKFHEDSAMAKERLKAWWDREIIDLPLVQYTYRKKLFGWRGYPDYWALIKPKANIQNSIADFKKKQKGIFNGGTYLPVFNLNYGPGCLAATLGIEPQFAGNTVWYKRSLKIEEVIPFLEAAKLDENNYWYSKFIEELEFAAKEPSFTVGIPSFAGIFDTLHFIMSFKDIVLNMRRKPVFIDTCRNILQSKLLKLIKDCNLAVLMHSDGVSNWLRIWSPKKWYVLQEDFAYNISPHYFKRFVLPDIIEQTENLDYSIYHLDGVEQLKFLDDLLEIPKLTGIQWVPGIQQETPGSLKWLPYFKKIQNADKNLIISVEPDEIKPILSNLNPKGLLMSTNFSNARSAKKYLSIAFDKN